MHAYPPAVASWTSFCACDPWKVLEKQIREREERLEQLRREEEMRREARRRVKEYDEPSLVEVELRSATSREREWEVVERFEQKDEKRLQLLLDKRMRERIDRQKGGRERQDRLSLSNPATPPRRCGDSHKSSCSALGSRLQIVLPAPALGFLLGVSRPPTPLSVRSRAPRRCPATSRPTWPSGAPTLASGIMTRWAAGSRIW